MALLHQAPDKTLAAELAIQLDNCNRENKNKFFLGCMGLLVRFGFVKEITLNFLMVGHTHEGS